MIYLDNSATTQIAPEVVDAMLPYLTAEYGNPSSKYYPLAVSAKKAVEESREKVAALIHAKPEEMRFNGKQQYDYQGSCRLSKVLRKPGKPYHNLED